ncbi:hypothetical protein SKAU_G00298000 [Synaphobranchus kaupii]|uniref:CASAMP N-terminal domain-containing protein n=1 Tax=Synaphobranchus kaupii TaxID=118154 RepID=A0A9Q1EV26_SYNKA|nr:hypothetical protein SKAU_G00298000 [Synaphobranchus kaupii]
MDSAMVDSNATRRTLVVPDVKPSDQYDFTRAKICASLGWLLAKSYGTAENVPVDLRDPFYSDQYEQEHMKPPVTRLLQSWRALLSHLQPAPRCSKPAPTTRGPCGDATSPPEPPRQPGLVS